MFGSPVASAEGAARTKEEMSAWAQPRARVARTRRARGSQRG